MFRGARASGDVRGPITQRAARRGVQASLGPAPRPSALPAGGLGLSALAAPEVEPLSAAGRGLARLSASASPSLPSLPILGFSIISQCDGHLSRSPGLSLCVRGVGRPHCFSGSCVPARLAAPARGLPGSGSLSPELCLGLCSSRPPPASASGFPPCLCASVSPGDRRSPSWSPRLWSSSWSLAESRSLPGFSSSRAEPRGSANTLPRPSNNEKPLRSGSP